MKKQRKVSSRTVIVTVVFSLVVGFVGFLGVYWLIGMETAIQANNAPAGETQLVATVEIIDENSSATGGVLSRRISEFVAQCELDFFELGYKVVKAIIPAEAVREVDLYIEGYNGYVKTVTDRGAGESAEDFDRMLRYLQGIGMTDFTYIDVRVEGKGYYRGA